MTIIHQPVLLQETIQYLNVLPGHWYIDATLGSGGHTMEILNKGGKVLGIDQDPEAVERSKKNIKTYPGTFLQHIGNFVELDKISTKYNLNQISGILFDLGISSDQLADPNKGLSFQSNTPLDMRLNPNLGVTAADLLKLLSWKQIEQMFTDYADEPRARHIAKLIVKHRERHPITTTHQLAQIALEAYGGKLKIHGIHPATKIFQALRIVVNNELENLESALPQALHLLSKGGRMVVISFHSGEDKIAKNFIKKNTQKIKILTENPITPSEEEIYLNPKSRSAKLRAIEKL